MLTDSPKVSAASAHLHFLLSVGNGVAGSQVLGTLVEDSDGKMVHLQLKLPKDEVTGKKKVVEFDFDVENDTIPDVANEMSEALNLTQLEQQEVSLSPTLPSPRQLPLLGL